MKEELQRGDAMRQGFKLMNRYLMVPMWRSGMGRLINIWPEGTGRIMVLVHKGRQSGRVYHTPLNYTLAGDDIVCMAGFGQKTDWYQNLLAAGEAEVWLPDGWWKVQAADISDSPDRLPLFRQLLRDTGFAAPLFEGIDYRTITDEELEPLGERWRLLCLRRVEARTGPGGPGEYAWVWALAAMVLLALWPLRRKK
jgi:deazaflavin-dependent oxidoreductase (nitroreductase family)